MRPDEIPQELVDILDRRAGKAHSPDGEVLVTLAEILTRYEEVRMAQCWDPASSGGLSHAYHRDPFVRALINSVEAMVYNAVLSEIPETDPRGGKDNQLSRDRLRLALWRVRTICLTGTDPKVEPSVTEQVQGQPRLAQSSTEELVSWAKELP